MKWQIVSNKDGNKRIINLGISINNWVHSVFQFHVCFWRQKKSANQTQEDDKEKNCKFIERHPESDMEWHSEKQSKNENKNKNQ